MNPKDLRSLRPVKALALVPVCLCILAYGDALIAAGYPTTEELNSQLRELASATPELFRVQPVCTNAKPDVLLLEIGRGEASERLKKPAMLVLAGAEGNDLAGSFVLLTWAHQLALAYPTNSDVHALLDSTMIYVTPRLNPEGTATYFDKPRWETTLNRDPFDDDHDGLVDEDGPEDLDHDGSITWMRVKDPEGDYILDPEEPRLLMKADRAKGEAGAYNFYSEGIDNDKDGKWNEDGPGGVNLNRNFPFRFQFFASDAGKHPMSDPVTRGLADFIVAHPHIGLVFAFGAADNLSETPKAEPPKGPRTAPTTLHPEDMPYVRELGKAWRDAIGLKKELPGATQPGTFADWMYFDRGRLALAARPWTPALQVELAKPPETKPDAKPSESKPQDKSETKAESSKPQGKEGETNQTTTAQSPPPEKQAQPAAATSPAKKTDDKRNEEERAFLKWLDKNAPEEFVPWKKFDHPDFPGQEVEIGGFAPFAKSTPPVALFEELARKEAGFLTTLAGKLPRVKMRKLTAKHLGEDVFEIVAQVENTGYLPTIITQGGITRDINPTRLVWSLEDKDILSGARRTMLPPIPGSGGMNEQRYTILARGKSQLELEVISALGGSFKVTVNLSKSE